MAKKKDGDEKYFEKSAAFRYNRTMPFIENASFAEHPAAKV